MRKLPLNTSFRHHTLVALVINLWLVTFLIFIAPFDASELNFVNRFKILPFYGVLCFGTYLLLIFIQNWFFKHYKIWNISLEIIFILVYDIALFFLSYLYYKTDIVNGNYDFKTFGLEVYLPICLIILPIFIFSRWFLYKKASKKSNVITLKGGNKLDILKILFEDLICVSSADNYIEVSYLIKGALHKKLLRNTLKSTQNDVPDLLKVHRSHLINPVHFKEWNGSNSIKLTEIEIPVSKNYRAVVMKLI